MRNRNATPVWEFFEIMKEYNVSSLQEKFFANFQVGDVEGRFNPYTHYLSFINNTILNFFYFPITGVKEVWFQQFLHTNYWMFRTIAFI